MGFVQCNFRNVAIVAMDIQRLCQPFFLNCLESCRGGLALEKRFCCNMDSKQIVGIPRFQLLFARRSLLNRKCFNSHIFLILLLLLLRVASCPNRQSSVILSSSCRGTENIVRCGAVRCGRRSRSPSSDFARVSTILWFSNSRKCRKSIVKSLFLDTMGERELPLVRTTSNKYNHVFHT
jgi:hypothetical protein